MKFDNEAEISFYDFLNDFELTSMVQKIESQVKVKYGVYDRRVDFILTLLNGHKIYIELDGEHHNSKIVSSKDAYKDWYTERIGNSTIRIKFKEFQKNKEKVANKIEAIIDLLSGD